MPGAGDLRERVGFYRRVEADDGFGNTVAGFSATPMFPPVSAQIKPKLGGEGVFASRLTGTNAVNITVRQSSDSRQVATDWIAKNERTGEIYNIRSIIDPDMKKTWLEFLCEKGAAV